METVYTRDYANHMKLTFGLIAIFTLAIIGLAAWGMIALA
jgi:succinate dehydrogenase hydrophobic anchor subunit